MSRYRVYWKMYGGDHGQLITLESGSSIDHNINLPWPCFVFHFYPPDLGLWDIIIHAYLLLLPVELFLEPGEILIHGCNFGL